MESTTRTVTQRVSPEQADMLRWRVWPLVDQPGWSWLVPIGVVGVGIGVGFYGGSPLLGVAAAIGLAGTLWQFFLPVQYEIDGLGLRRFALGRSRLIPWRAVRSYRLRPTGIVLYQRDDPTPIDMLRSMFVPYSNDEDEMLCTMREHLAHALELPAEVPSS